MFSRASKTIIGTTAVLAATLLNPPAAQADSLSYLQSLNNHGFNVYDAGAAIDTGWQICDALNYQSGDVVAQRLYVSTTWYDVPTPVDAAIWVLVAVEELCPWHDHRGELEYAI